MPEQTATHLCWHQRSSVSLSISVGSKDGVTTAAERAFVKLDILSIMNVLSYLHHMYNVTKSPACLIDG